MTPGRRAFTLLEALIAVAVGLLVLGLVIGLLWWSSTTLVRLQERSQPRERAYLALLALGGALRDGWHYRVEDEGARIRFVTTRLWGEAHWDRRAGELVLVPPGAGAAPQVLARDVTDFGVASLAPGCLRLTIALGRGRAGVKVVHELLLPAVALRTQAVPWNPSLEHPTALEPSR